MYTDTSSENTYSKFLYKQPEENPVVSSIVEQSPISRSQIQENWNIQIASIVDQIAEVNPYLPNVEIGQELTAPEAIAWVKGSRNLDCRPKLYDGESKSWKLCDTGSMITVIRKSPGDKLDETRFLQAVNGSKIKVYGQKQIQVRLGRKTYPITATIADVQQDILGWDFIDKHKLDLVWSESRLDLYLYDKRSKIKQPLKFVTVPPTLLQTSAVISTGQESRNTNPDVAAFEVASMKLLGAEFESDKKEKIQPKYLKLIDQFPGILTPSFKDLSTKHGVTHKIQTGSAPPSKARVRPLLANSEKAIKGKEAWDTMVKLGVVERIEPNANSDWGSSLHLVPKPDGSMRPCSDFRQLNAKTVPDGYPLPNLKSFSHNLHGAKIFSKLDVQAAFHNVVIDPQDVHKTTTLTPWGVFVYKRLAFRLCGAPSTFMKLMDNILAGLDGVYAYLDDLLVYSDNEQLKLRAK